jgi:predicted transcriptional regulator
MPKANWTVLEPQLRELRARGTTNAEIAKALGVTISTVESKLRRLGLTGQSEDPKDDNLDEAFALAAYRKLPEKPSIDRIFDGCIAAQGFQEQFNISEYSVEREIKAERPVVITFWSDLHIGSAATDYALLKAHTKLIKDRSNLYVCLGGDGWEGFLPSFKNAGAVASQVVSPQLQMLAYRQLLTELKGKVISICGGNHNDMLVKKTGVDATRFVLDGMNFPYLPNGGLIKLTVGGVEYKIIQKHHWRFNSSLNKFNSHHRMRDFLYSAADVFVTEHEHNPGMETEWIEEYDTRRQIVNIRTGAYKIGDPFSRRLWKDGVPGPECLVLFPDRKKIVPFDGVDAIEDALRYCKR